MANSESENKSIKIELFSGMINIKVIALWCIFAGLLSFFLIKFDFTYFIFQIYTYTLGNSDSLFYYAVIFLYVYITIVYLFVLFLVTMLFDTIYFINKFPRIKIADMLLNVNSKIPCATAFAVFGYIIYTLENSLTGGLFIGHIRSSYVLAYIVLLGFTISLCLGFYKAKHSGCGFKESKLVYGLFLLLTVLFCWSHVEWLSQALDFCLFNAFPLKHMYTIGAFVMMLLEFVICCINNDIKWLKADVIYRG